MAQVRYRPVHAVQKRALVSDFEAAIDERYVAEDPQTPQAFAIQIASGPAPPPVIPSEAAEVVWPFRDSERGYVVSLSSSSLAVEVDAQYHDFPQFVQEFSVAVNAFASVFHPKRQVRLGLRYVNEIEDSRLGGKEGLGHFLNEDLIAPIGKAIQGGVIRSLSELRVQEEDGIFVLRHGLVDEAKYLLDFDHFTEGERAFDPNQIVQTVSTYHDLVESFFVWSLSDTYLKELKKA